MLTEHKSNKKEIKKTFLPKNCMISKLKVQKKKKKKKPTYYMLYSFKTARIQEDFMTITVSYWIH